MTAKTAPLAPMMPWSLELAWKAYQTSAAAIAPPS
jgi:hypothetical protein